MGSRAASLVRVVWIGLISSFQDYRRMFTWRSWAFGWVLRLVSQVVFFTMLTRIGGRSGGEQFAAVGNAVVLAPLATLGLVASTTMERRLGTLQFLLVSRTNPLLALGSRGLYWIFDGMVTSLIALAALPAVLDVHVDYRRFALVPLLLAVPALSAFAMALALSGLSLRWTEARTLITGCVSVLLLTVAGVNVPAARHGFAGVLAHCLPVTNSLPALRAVVAGGAVRPGGLLAEAAVAAGWLALAHLTVTFSIRWSVAGGRLTVGA